MFCLFKRFELSEAVGRLEQLELAAVFRLNDWNEAVERLERLERASFA
jgi:hypothetical protein